MRRCVSIPVRQRGVAALAVTLALVVVMTLGATVLHRSLIVEQRASGNQVAAAQAFEAAEAGLQWVEAQLNADRRLGDDCLPSTDPGADSFRERYLVLDPGTERLRPRSTATAATARPGCARSASGFVCGCPAGGPAASGMAVGDGQFPAFRVDFFAGDRPGAVRVVSTGCNDALPPCTDSGTRRADATARVEVTLGLLGAFRVPPAARLTAAGHVDTSAALFPAAPPATGRAGTPGAAAHGMPSIGTGLALGSDRFFAASFGLDRPRWQARPVVTRVVCRTDCATALTAAIGDRGAGAVVWVDGDLALSGPVVLGSPSRPVLLVVDGDARLRGAVEIHGALYAGAVAWDDAEPGIGAAVHGALLAERDYRGSAAVAFHDDPLVLATLTRFAGSFARVGGSWRDFR